MKCFLTCSTLYVLYNLKSIGRRKRNTQIFLLIIYTCGMTLHRTFNWSDNLELLTLTLEKQTIA